MTVSACRHPVVAVTGTDKVTQPACLTNCQVRTTKTNTAMPKCHVGSLNSVKTPALNRQFAGLTSEFLSARGTTSSAFSTSPAPFSSALGWAARSSRVRQWSSSVCEDAPCVVRAM